MRNNGVGDFGPESLGVAGRPGCNNVGNLIRKPLVLYRLLTRDPIVVGHSHGIRMARFHVGMSVMQTRLWWLGCLLQTTV